MYGWCWSCSFRRETAHCEALEIKDPEKPPLQGFAHSGCSTKTARNRIPPSVSDLICWQTWNLIAFFTCLCWVTITWLACRFERVFTCSGYFFFYLPNLTSCKSWRKKMRFIRRAVSVSLGFLCLPETDSAFVSSPRWGRMGLSCQFEVTFKKDTRPKTPIFDPSLN